MLCTQTASALLLLFGHGAVAGLYSADPQVIALGGALLLYAALFQFPDGLQVLAAGALRVVAVAAAVCRRTARRTRRHPDFRRMKPFTASR